MGAMRPPLCLCEPECGGGGEKKGCFQSPPVFPKGAGLWAWRVGAQWNTGVSKANFQSHSRALISHCEVASVASGLHVVMDTKAWDPRDGERGDEWLPCL